MAKTTAGTETPLMKQYNGIKTKYPDAVLLFRVGDFYETFGEDAIRVSKILDIVLTKRGNTEAGKLELAGFPHHSLDTYLPKLVRAGLRVAICDQLEDPKEAKGIVKRGVTELVTPGVSYNDEVLSSKTNNYLMAIHQENYKGESKNGFALLDISTGEFLISEGDENQLQKIIQSFRPSEIIFQKGKNFHFSDENISKYRFEDWAFQYDFALERLTKHFQTNSLKGFGIEDYTLAITAAGAVLAYLEETQHHKIGHISAIKLLEESNFVWMDAFTVRNLELIHSAQPQAVTLFDCIDKTLSPMGARMLRRWLAIPLKSVKDIKNRQELVHYFIDETNVMDEIRFLLKRMADVERLVAKSATQKISPRELFCLNEALETIVEIKQKLIISSKKEVQNLANSLEDCTELRTTLTQKLSAEPPHQIIKGNVIAEGVSEELDFLRNIQTSGKGFLDDLRDREIARTGISSLKVSFNNVFGYYLEVSNTHRDKVPEEWIRKQTLVNAERYITPELKEYETQILGAEDKIYVLETQLYQKLVEKTMQFIRPIQTNGQLIAQIDCLSGFAFLAMESNYTKPEINESRILHIEDGRHPVIEKRLPLGETYITNSLYLNPDDQQIIMITGPNMSGKSALLRQTALIVILAQIGSYVPAKSAEIGIVDKIFTRVGASDNISLGESTFMVEMNETASILNNLTDRSLILLDEIGRGTSTYDGISIAWSIAEFLHENSLQPKTLFATHYHELNEMTQTFPRIKNFHVSVRELKDKILFLRKLEAGGTEHSFGIHVAKMAGMPTKVVIRAGEILKVLEQKNNSEDLKHKTKNLTYDNMQLSFFQLDDPILEGIREELLNTNIDILTPIEALMKLNEIKKILGR